MKQHSPKALATREKILRAANALFYEQGYNATALDKIIHQAGVAKGNFYHHFKNKEALATAVLDWHRELAFEEVGLRGLLAEPDALEALLTLVRRMTGRMVSDSGACHIRGCFFGNFALELSTGSEPVRRKVQHIFDGIRDIIATLLARAQADGQIRTTLDTGKTAGVILGLMEGAVLLDKAGQNAAQTDNAADFIRTYLAQVQ